MNNKKVIMIVGLLVLMLFTTSAYLLVKSKINKTPRANVEIKCETSNEVGELKVDDSFTCTALGTKYIFTVKSIEKDKMIIKSDKTGLTKVKEDGSINLREQEDTFEIEKGTSIKLSPQATDVSAKIELTWKK